MKPRGIEDYGLIGNGRTAALIHRSGSLDWLCWPRFDSLPCFARLLGEERNGHWLIAPSGAHRSSRKYRADTLVLETRFECDEGAVNLIDFMPQGSDPAALIRLVRGVRGQVRMMADFSPRFDGGKVQGRFDKSVRGLTPKQDTGWELAASRHDLCCADEVRTFVISEGEEIAFILCDTGRSPSDPGAFANSALTNCTRTWRKWASRCAYNGPWRNQVVQSLIALKALIYAPSGGIVAAPTTSLPERMGGHRNWDYRFCWLRDSTFTVLALLHAGYREEAAAWTQWLLTATGRDRERTHPFYGICEDSKLKEYEVPWLPGFDGSAPVRFGNGAQDQLQTGIYGEVLDTLFQWRQDSGRDDAAGWASQRRMLAQLESLWREPDAGIWEQRGHHECFTQSGAFAWLAADRAVKSVEKFGYEGPLEKWRAWRNEIHGVVCKGGYEPELKAFTRAFHSRSFDASTLLLPMVGFLPAADPRMEGTVRAIQNHLCDGPFVYRYDQSREHDGVGGPEGAFLPCSFWLADNLILQKRQDEAAHLFEKLLSACNDLGLVSEEYDVSSGRLLGNFPQALTHLSLAHTALNLQGGGPVHTRSATY